MPQMNNDFETGDISGQISTQNAVTGIWRPVLRCTPVCIGRRNETWTEKKIKQKKGETGKCRLRQK